MRYYVVVYKRNGKRISEDEFDDAGRAYEFAHEKDAEKSSGCYVRIEDQFGNDKWLECADIRCPSVGLFQ